MTLLLISLSLGMFIVGVLFYETASERIDSAQNRGYQEARKVAKAKCHNCILRFIARDAVPTPTDEEVKNWWGLDKR